MINVAIYGANQIGAVVKKIIDTVYNPSVREVEENAVLRVGAYIAAAETGGGESISVAQFVEAYHSGILDALIIPTDLYIGNFNLVHILIANNVSIEDIYFMGRVSNVNFDNPLDLFTPYLEYSYLPYLEFHIADKCNLNCKACEHYAGLVKEEHFPDFKEFRKDFEKLHSLISDIGVIRILGGEPLLNPEVELYVKLCREVYPESIIYIVTNALRIKQMPDSFFDTMRENNACIYISYYLPMQDSMESIIEFIEQKNVMVHRDGLVTYFTKKQILQPLENEKVQFMNCVQSRCNNLRDGEMAACFLPFTTKFFNDYYDKDIPEDGAISLYKEGITTRELKTHLLTPFERCRYCSSSEEIPWEQIGNPSPITDWVKADLY